MGGRVASSRCDACCSTPPSSRSGRSRSASWSCRPRSALPLTPAGARGAIAEAAGWLERGVRPGGLYTYGYDRKHDALSEDYNITRHAGVMFGLYRLAGETDDEEALSAAEHGLSFVHANLLRNDDWTAFAEPGQDARLGASGLLAIALIQRRLATGDESEDDLIRGLARFLAAQQQADGSVLGRWSLATEERRPGRIRQVRHRPGALDVRAPRQALSGRRMGEARAPARAFRGHAPRRRRGLRAPVPRPLVGLRVSRSSGRTSWASRRSNTRAISPGSSASTPASSRKAGREVSTASFAASRPPARASGP